MSTALAAALIATSAVAKGPGGGPGGGGGHGGGGSGGGGEEGVAKNLSVPGLFVPGTTGAPTLSLPCGAAVLPTGETTYFAAPYDDPEVAGDGVPGAYYVQGEDQWQASCAVAADNTLSSTVEWGDNLISAPLKAGTPIRVEAGLLAVGAAPMTGFTVYKLTDELDRVATYGTLGVAETPFPEVRIWNAGVTLKIERSDGFIVYQGAFTAEVNSTGRIVYGFNWQKPLAGTYTITITVPTVLLTGADAGTITADGHSASIQINVAAKAGGGKKP